MANGEWTGERPVEGENRGGWHGKPVQTPELAGAVGKEMDLVRKVLINSKTDCGNAKDTQKILLF